MVVLICILELFWNGGCNRVGSDTLFGMLRVWIGSWKFVKLHLNCKSDLQICFLTDVLIVFMGGGNAEMTYFASMSI